MTNASLAVPYSYRAEVLPGGRRRSPVVTWLRGEIAVSVPFVAPGEYEAAFELPRHRSAGGYPYQVTAPRRMVVHFAGRLYAPLTVDGRNVTLPEAANAFAEPAVFGPEDGEDTPFRHAEALAYPLARAHLWQPQHGPLHVRTLESQAKWEDWEGSRLVDSDLPERQLEAVVALAHAFVVIDGLVYMECPEPVWTLAPVGRNRHRLMLETAPWACSAIHHFRLDRHRQALAWAASLRIRLAPHEIEPPIEILLPSALRRKDDVELAREAALTWPRLEDGAFASCEPLGDGTEIEPTLAALTDDRSTADHAAAVRAMAALDRLLKSSDHVFGRRNHELLLVRWKKDNPAPDLFSVGPGKFGPEDIVRPVDHANGAASAAAAERMSSPEVGSPADQRPIPSILRGFHTARQQSHDTEISNTRSEPPPPAPITDLSMPSGTFVDVPFTYQAAVLPGPRHKRPRDVTLRANAIIEVPHLTRGDFTKVIRIEREPVAGEMAAEEPRDIFQRDGRLFSPMTIGGRAVPMDALSEALKQSAAAKSWWPGDRLDRRQFPMINQRHRREVMSPLCHPTLAEKSTSENWPASRAVRSDYDDAMGAAAEYLSEALAIVDGVVWAECCEPVWELRHESYNRYSLVCQRWPTLLRSPVYFRLDERERALDYAATRRWRIEPMDLDPETEILDPSAITRSDIPEIAAAMLRGWPWLRWYAPPGDEGTAILKSFYAEREVAIHDVPTFMRLISPITDGPAAERIHLGRNHADVAAIFQGLRRWRYEEATVDPARFNQFDEADLLAMEDIF